ncbi:MAG TPA: 3-isopropylmalate dehydratase large subunit [Methanomassiliicoccales archaeon]|jgi:3-isopropylmalate/(R)-2-methylmalate dehydratase large subunit|nr:3-isopropylmalate dehydratase large subunit [Methanomassiliicoccales archaeon]
MAPKTFAEKVLSRASGSSATAGDIVTAKVDLAMSHENTALVLRAFKEMGAKRILNPEKLVILFDHRVPANTVKAAESHREIRQFVGEMEIPTFYDAGEGVCHEVLPSKGHVLPGMLAVGSDSHTVTYGALGAFATGIGATEMAAVWALGELWLRVPETIRIAIEGRLPKIVSAKDVILRIIGDIGSDGADYACVEFTGPVVDSLSVAGRMVLSNMSVEMGAKAGVCFPDAKTEEYLSTRTQKKWNSVLTDKGAKLKETRSYEMSDLVPQVARPHSVDNVVPVDKTLGVKIDQAVLGSCTNGRMEDLLVAESILRGKRVPRNVRLIVAPASRDVYVEASEQGVLASLMRSGAIVLNPGCGPCLGAHEGLLAAGERCIASTNRNFRGRMGSPDAEVYLASPATVAASALKGEIADPREVLP